MIIVEEEIVMKTNITKIVIALLGAYAASSFAATTGAVEEGSSPLVWFFIGFGVLVIMLQAVPAMILFVSMLRGLFSPHAKEAHLPKV
jgi:hypothetical protein